MEKAVALMDRNHIGIIYGGPGTGKTTVLKFIIDRIIEKSLSFVLAAPTGKAAKRMSEATGQDAKTIHRMLEPTFHKGTSTVY